MQTVQRMVASPANAEVQHDGCFALLKIANGSATRKKAVIVAGGPAAIVAAMQQHAADANVQRGGCFALMAIASGDATCNQAVMHTGALAAIVAAMKLHAADANVQRGGCFALRALANGGDDKGKRAVMDAGGPAAIVAAMKQHVASAEVQCGGCDALGAVAYGDATCDQALVHVLQAQLAAAQEVNARLLADCERARRAALARFIETNDVATPAGVMSIAAGPFTHYSNAYQSALQRCFTTVEIWNAEQPHVTAPFHVEVGMLRQLWAEGGRGRHAGPSQGTLLRGFSLTRIEAIEVPARDREAFYTRIDQTGTRRDVLRCGEVDYGSAAYPNGDRIGEKAAVLARLKARFLPHDKNRQDLVLALHGCSHEAADCICKAGFTVVPLQDRLGRGFYLTTHSEYACLKACRNPPNAAGEHVLIAAFAAPGLTYPVSRTVDYSRPSQMHSDSRLRGQPLQPQFNSHYAFVSAEHNFECMDGARKGYDMDYDELVCEVAAQVLPAYRLYFRAR
jgi:hypothetical protein